MWTYDTPLRDMRFVIEEVLSAPQSWASMPAYADMDGDTAAQVLEEAGKFAAGVLVPLNGPGDLEGCTLKDGRVSTPAGYRPAYRAFVDAGWPALACDPEYGGQGLPQLLNAALYEMLAACCHGFTMYPGLLHGAYECLKAHGSPALRGRYLPRIVSGEWLSTMCLTEPQAGSDLGQVRCKAVAQADGSCRVTGNKIFISGGDQDLTDNIVHLVLCRLQGADGAAAPPGSKGLSLVLCPKVLPDGVVNAVRCDGVEKKMGIKGSATCVMGFEGATGWLIGEPNRGLAAMFVMMNAARLHVGMQGLGHLEMATQNALRYAHEREQMRAPIASHPAVRRTLWGLRAMLLGGRVLAYWTASLLDESEQHPDPEQRARALQLTELLTPVVKAFLTHHGHDGATRAQQVWGGYGYVHEYGIEQTVRDSRIAMIYEGTNEIQAIDLVQRKWLQGERLPLLLQALSQEAAMAEAMAGAHPALAAFAAALRGQAAAMAQADAALRRASHRDAEAPLRVADDALQGLGYALMAWAWARAARAALAHPGDAWYAERVSICEHGLRWMLPQAAVHWARVDQASAELPVLAAAR